MITSGMQQAAFNVQLSSISDFWRLLNLETHGLF